jgi:hypothetical protein
MRRPGVERQRRSGTARDVRFSCHRRRRARLQGSARGHFSPGSIGSPRIARMWNLQSAWRPIRRSCRTILPPASRTRGPKTTPWLLARARAGGRILWPRSGRSRSGGNCAKLSLKRTCARQRIFCTIIAAPQSIGQSSHLILFSMSTNQTISRRRKQFSPGAKPILPEAAS